MAHVSLYRKYRSQTFGDLIGQDHVVRTLQNAVAQGKISHAYLFTGPRGTGKTSTARLLAKSLCAENGPTADPQESDPIVQSITDGSCPDVIEIDAASESSVESIRENIIETAEYRPLVARYRVYIIDEVHDLSAKAFDALLKTIEEPPAHLIFILATTEYNKVPPTIRSRCQKYEFHRASMQNLAARIQHVADAEGVTIDPEAVTAIARMADGAYRDALTLLEQAMITADGHITLAQVYDQLGLVPETTVDNLLTHVAAQNIPEVLALLEEVFQLGRDPRALLESGLYRLADLTRATYDIRENNDAVRHASLHETAARLGRETILRLRGEFAAAHKEIRNISLPRLWLESELVRISQDLARPAVGPVRTDARSAESRPPERRGPEATPAAPRAESRSQERRAQEPRAQEPRSQEPRSQESRSPEMGSGGGKPAESGSPSAVPAEQSPGLDSPGKDSPVQDSSGGESTSWERVLAQFKPGMVHPLKLATASIESFDSDVLTVAIARSIDLDWWNENPKRLGFLETVVREVYGPKTRLRLVAGQRAETPRADTGAVEYVLQGDPLADAIKRIVDEVEPDGKPE